MSVAATSLITLDQLKAYLGSGFSGNVNDALLELLIDGVSAMFDAHLGRTLAKTTFADIYFDGNGRTSLWLPNGPVIELASLYEDDELLVEGSDAGYVLYPGTAPSYLPRIDRMGAVWLKGPKTVKLTKTAGFTVQGATLGDDEIALPADLRLACSIQVAREWKKTQGAEWGESARSFPDGSTTRVEGGLLKEVKEILAKYEVYRI